MLKINEVIWDILDWCIRGDGMSGKLIVSFTHTNYCIRSAGTEKYVRGISELLQEYEYNHLNFFGIYHNHILGKDYVGVNYNDGFLGIFKNSEIENVIDYIMKSRNLELNSIHLEHLLNHNLCLISTIVKKYKVGIIIFVHDYYLLCNFAKLIDSRGDFCGTEVPSIEKCVGCDNCKTGIEHYRKICNFFESINCYIRKIVVPSRYVQEVLQHVFPQYSQCLRVRPHLRLEGNRKYNINEERISIAYVGAPIASKGYNVWKEVVQHLNENCPGLYDLYYFGTGTEIIENVTNVYVSIAEQGDDAMVKALKKYNITCAFVWPSWPETYSYVYYELAISGAFIISNRISGNIHDEIVLHKNGMIFDSIDDCILWIKDYNTLRGDVHSFKKWCSYAPEKYFENKDITDIVCDDATQLQKSALIKNKPNRNVVLSFIYLKKHKGLLNRIMSWRIIESEN